MGKYIDYYCCNNRLQNMVDHIIKKHFGWIPQKDYDDFYSIAGQAVWYCEKNFDESKGKNFEKYLVDSLYRKIKTQLTYNNRQKRNNGMSALSLEAMIEDGDMCLMGIVASEDASELLLYSDKMQLYLSRLSKLQKKVLFALADGYSSDEIKNALNISAKEYSDICASIKAYRNVSLLY